MKCYIKDYPRPQLVRKDWKNLNGKWKFWYGDEEQPRVREITVPFTYETSASGINDTDVHGIVWYERTVELKSVDPDTHSVLLHFEGSDYRTRVWINGWLAGEHTGGYERFTFDITEYIKSGENKIRVCVEDSLSMTQPRGKQRWQKENFGCWYVQTTGIWKTVWIESVPQNYLKYVKMTPDVKNRSLHLEYEMNLVGEQDCENLVIETEICMEDRVVNRSMTEVTGARTKMSLSLERQDGTEPWAIYLWRPEDPRLYDVTFRVWRNGQLLDQVYSYFGMREIEIRDGNILLNGIPLYQKLILDQGYWEESHLTPPSEEALIEDIDKIHALGYNGLRKHEKVEDERFLYWCDVKGMLVWSEAPSTYRFDDDAIEAFSREWLSIVKQNYNHPCIIVWTPFNESWGIPQVRTDKRQQDFTVGIYYMTKAIDAMRPVICNDGWEHTVSDILTLHDYEADGNRLYRHYMDCRESILNNQVPHSGERFAFAEGYHYQGQPVIISEFGGIALTGDDDGWGYGDKVESEEEFLQRFRSVTQAIKNLPYVCGYCYTQVSDVQQEVNGLMDIRRNYKTAPEKIKEVNNAGRNLGLAPNREIS